MSTYFCKKCGSVVSGKFCSCCGTRASSDFADFRRTQGRMQREFKEKAYRKYSNLGHDAFAAQEFACRAMEMAFDRILPKRKLNQTDFDSVSDYAWMKLPECQELGELLFNRIEDAVLKEDL